MLPQTTPVLVTLGLITFVNVGNEYIWTLVSSSDPDRMTLLASIQLLQNPSEGLYDVTKSVLAVGAHIGDMDLTAGPLLAELALQGHRVVLAALTPGERGHPRLTPEAYKEQKIAEGQAFATGIGGEFHVFDHSDGFLAASDEVAMPLAELIRELKPEVLVAHWKHSIHSDHSNASMVAERARYLAGLPMGEDVPRHGVRQFLYAENWEDAEAFEPTVYAEISDPAFERWHAAISGQAFARGETYGFRYIDYYTALMTMRGCLFGVPRASAFATSGAGRARFAL